MTQEQKVIRQLLDTGKCSRNWALSNYISRLGALVCDLNKSGWNITGDFVKTAHGKDYVYTLIESPIKRVDYIVDGRLVESKYEKV